LNASSQEGQSPRLLSAATGERLLPKDENNQWWTYDNETTIAQLMQALNERGIREQNLLQNLKKISPFLQTEFEQIKQNAAKMKSASDQSQNTDAELSTENLVAAPLPTNDILSALRNDLEDMEARLRQGSLGGFIVTDNYNEWHDKLKNATDRCDLAELLIQLQQTVAEKYASGIFGTHEYQTKSSKAGSRKKLPSARSSLSKAHQLQIWSNDCRTCKTLSRLYLLMMIFENSIAWSKSTVGLKCKVCRKKNKDEYIVVCDQCCQGYHLDCLRCFADDQIKTSVNDLWYCPACRPQPISRRRGARQGTRSRAKNEDYDADIYDMDVDSRSNSSAHDRIVSGNQDLSDFHSEQNEEGDSHQMETASNDETSCCVCGVEPTDENELIRCVQCRSYFHCQCHEPPLRCAPRSTTWMCTSCRNGVNNENHASVRRSSNRRAVPSRKPVTKHRQQPTRRTARRNYRERDEDDFDDDDSDYEQQTNYQRRSKRLRRSSPLSTRNTEEKFELDDDDNDDDDGLPRTRRRIRIAKSTSSSSSSSDEEHMILDDQSDIIGEDDDDHEHNGGDDDDENGASEARFNSSN
jgi:hypothetical protein